MRVVRAGWGRLGAAVRTWALAVAPRGRVAVRLPGPVRVRPLDPLRPPGAERVLVRARGGGLHVLYDEARREVAVAAGGGGAVDVTAPACFDLDIKTWGTGCVKVENMECENCRIETEKGTSILNSIKSHTIHVQTNGGKIIGLGSLHGNTDIHVTGECSVNIEKLQGTSINISTEDGLLKTKYLYAESSFLSSAAGDILLGSVHGDITIETKTGNITVDSADGCLKASTHQGMIDVYVSQGKNIDLKSQKGSITVKVPASFKAYLQLSGSKVDVSPEIELKEIQSAPKDGHITITGKAKNQRRVASLVQLEKSFLIPKNRWWTRPRDPGSKFIMDNYKAERGRDGRSYRAAEKVT
ncbi:protein FAM185A isoform X2 [Alligator mississippiensis]|uniref:protein FAM185A isoform X2 n=1 Tax=Alligator mississippiensis TaxID=8496 RepID=UPI00287794DB|nr:protein FAM185A isoform X2 [Alligator mississippiensis]